MRFYVASKFQHYVRARGMVDYLTSLGHEVTYDWTRTPEFDEKGHPIQEDPHAIPKDELRVYAENDINGVLDADFFVLLGDHPALNGALVEMGAALASPKCKHVLVVNLEKWSIFVEHSKVQQFNGLISFNLFVTGLPL